MLWRWVTLLLVAVQGLSAFETTVAAKAAIVMNADTGAILFEKKSHEPHYPASTMKMATALYALVLKGDSLDQEVIADAESLTRVVPSRKEQANYALPAYWLETDAKLLDIQVGQVLTVRDLLYGTLVASAGDSSNLLARHAGGTITQFMEGLNNYLKELGCKNTNLMNPHGLHHPEQVVSAYDLALIAREGLRYPDFREAVKVQEFTLSSGPGRRSERIKQTNRLLRDGSDHYEAAIGVKTGWTSAASNTFVAAAERNGRTLICVLLGVDSRRELWKETRRLFDIAYKERLVRRRLYSAGPLPYQKEVKGAAAAVRGALAEDLMVEFYPSEKPELQADIAWAELTPPIAKGAQIGEVVLRSENSEFIRRVPLLAAEDVDEVWWRKFGWPMVALLVFGALYFFMPRR